MKVLADSLMGQEDIPVELYREFMTDIGAEIDRENKIINDLLSLVKMDKSAGNINITSVQINELLGADHETSASDRTETERGTCYGKFPPGSGGSR